MVPRDQLVVVDRSTVLGNPFTHLNLATTKAKFKSATVFDAINDYQQWLITTVKDDFAGILIRRELRFIYDKAVVLSLSNKPLYLGCWCMDETMPSTKDHACHSQVIRNVIYRKYHVNKPPHIKI